MLPSRLNAICDADACAAAGWTLVDFATACLDGGATFLQLRAKHADAHWFFDVASVVVERARAAGALVIVNDRADVARAVGAGGVHVGQDDLRPTDVRGLVGEHSVVGLSTHTTDQLEAAVREPVNYVAIGPVFTTSTKDTGYTAVGFERVREAARVAAPHGHPVVAIGGITIDRAADVIDAGAAAVAIISDLLSTGDPAGRVRDYLRRLAI